MKNIVIIGGGTGTFTLLSGLRKYPTNNTVIVSSADDGGSTGILRKELGVFPPGDIRQCLVGLSYTQSEMQKLFNFRFDKGGLAGHTVGNIIIAALEKITGSVESSINIASKILNVRGAVLPVSLNSTTLSAILKNGKKIVGEHYIDDQNPKGKTSPIKELKLSPAKANPKVVKALQDADVIIFGPGDLYTSILPNLLVSGVKKAINKSEAKKILITNIMTKFGQTDGFRVSNFVEELKKYLGGKLDVVIANSKIPDKLQLGKYKKEKAEPVKIDAGNQKKQAANIVKADLLSTATFNKSAGDKLKRSFLRHDSDKLAKLIWDVIH